MRFLRDQGLSPRADDDGDIITEVDHSIVILSVNDNFLHARLMFTTTAPVNALAIVSRRLNQRLLCGRLVFPDEGEMFIIDLAHRYNEVPSKFDSLYVMAGVLEVSQAVVDIANEYGYQL